MNIIPSHQNLVTFGIGLAITFAVAAVLGALYPEQAFANNQQFQPGFSCFGFE
jgi:hypothetical protein